MISQDRADVSMASVLISPWICIFGSAFSHWLWIRLCNLLWPMLLLFSHVWLFVTLWTAAPSGFPVLHYLRVCSNSCPLSQWCHPTISSSVTCFSSCPQSFPASWSFPRSWLFASSGQSIGTSVSVLPMNIQGWFPLGLTSVISWLSKRLSRVFSSTTILKHQFFSAQPLLLSDSHIHTWLLEKP